MYSRRLTHLTHLLQLYYLTLIPPGYDLYKLELLILTAWSTMKEGKLAVKQNWLGFHLCEDRPGSGNWRDLVQITRFPRTNHFAAGSLSLIFISKVVNTSDDKWDKFDFKYLNTSELFFKGHPW